MLQSKKPILFNKNENSISNKINEFEASFDEIVSKNSSYKIPEKYNWDFISNQYLEVFKNLTNYQNK